MEIIQNNHVISTICGIMPATSLRRVQLCNCPKPHFSLNCLGFSFELLTSYMKKYPHQVILPRFQKKVYSAGQEMGGNTSLSNFVYCRLNGFI